MEEDKDKENPHEQIILPVPVLGWGGLCFHAHTTWYHGTDTLAYSALETES